MKVIFLDIDGVLCSMRSSMAYSGPPVAAETSTWTKFDEVSIRLLQEAVRSTGAVVVLTSSWRGKVGKELLQWRLGVRLEDVTRPEKDGEVRGNQIKDWLDDHPEVTHYAILDDDEDMLPEQMPHLILTSKRNGFLLGHYDQLCEALS